MTGFAASDLSPRTSHVGRVEPLADATVVHRLVSTLRSQWRLTALRPQVRAPITPAKGRLVCPANHAALRLAHHDRLCRVLIINRKKHTIKLGDRSQKGQQFSFEDLRVLEVRPMTGARQFDELTLRAYCLARPSEHFSPDLRFVSAVYNQ
jgi:hypothetical protein